MQRTLAWSIGVVASAIGLFLVNAASATSEQTARNIHALPPLSVGATQTLQVNLANVSEPDPDPTRTTLVVQGRLLDRRGRELGRSASRTIERNATFSWRIARDVLSTAPADDRGRVLVRVELDVVGVPRVGGWVPSVALVDEQTGGVPSGTIGDTRTVISGQSAYASAHAGLHE